MILEIQIFRETSYYICSPQNYCLEQIRWLQDINTIVKQQKLNYNKAEIQIKHKTNPRSNRRQILIEVTTDLCQCCVSAGPAPS